MPEIKINPDSSSSNQNHDCLSDIQKIDLQNILNSWLYEKIGTLETLEKDPSIDQNWLIGFRTRLTSGKELADKLLNFKTCKGGEL